MQKTNEAKCLFRLHFSNYTHENLKKRNLTIIITITHVFLVILRENKWMKFQGRGAS